MEQAGATDEIRSAIEQGPITKQYGLWSIDETEDTEAVECDPMIVECYSTLGRAMGTSTEGQRAAYVSIPGPSPMRALRRSWRVTEYATLPSLMTGMFNKCFSFMSRIASAMAVDASATK